MKKNLKILFKTFFVVILPIALTYVLANLTEISLAAKIFIVCVLFIQSFFWASMLDNIKLLPKLNLSGWTGIGLGIGFEDKALVIILPFIIFELKW